jgi:hypothetical protein
MKIRIHSSCAAMLLACATASFAQPPATSPTNDPTSMPDPKMLHMDKDGDGKISRQEADTAMQKNWDRWDVNQDGYVDTAEFSAGGKGNARSTAPPKN